LIPGSEETEKIFRDDAYDLGTLTLNEYGDDLFIGGDDWPDGGRWFEISASGKHTGGHNGLVCGVNEDGSWRDAHIALEELTRRVVFCRDHDLKPITASAAAKARKHRPGASPVQQRSELKGKGNRVRD
jgi:hypothetical protein